MATGDPRTLTVKIRTRTPLWTGGVDSGTMDRIHETGLIGSLRWWYEAIVRGLGGWACDPSEHTCSFDVDKYRKSAASDERQRLRDAGLCDVCQVFGTTGWQRRFRLEVRPLEGEFDVTEGMFPSGRVHFDKKKNSYRTGGWLLRGGYHGEMELKFIGNKEVLWCEILPVLLFAEKWGALGAKTSLGYGVFEILSINGHHKEAGQCWREFLKENRDIAPLDLQQCSSRVGRWWWRGESSNRNQYQDISPALSNMFFAKVRFSPDVLSASEEWWEQFREVQWLKQGNIPKNEATWTGNPQRQPPGPYEISNPLPLSRLQHWVACHNTFPIAPIFRTRLRYGHHSVCNGNGESGWCKFVFGTVQGKSPVCGYCGTPVRPDKKDQDRWWCNTGKVSLDNSMVIRDAKRIQSKIRISWVFQINEQEWEMRLWGWIPENQRHQHSQQRVSLLQNLRNVLGVNSSNARQWHSAQNGQLWQDTNIAKPRICWFEREANEHTEDYLKALLQCHCTEANHDKP